MSECVFCAIVAGRAPAKIRDRRADVWVIEPLNPVTEGHVLVIPKQHVFDAATHPLLTGRVFERAAEWAADVGHSFNLITSAGREASQTVFHLHVHYVPRTPSDGLHLPWSMA